MMLLTANLSLPSLCLLLVRGHPKLLTMWKMSFIWNDCRKNLFFSERPSMLNASFVHTAIWFLLSTYSVPACSQRAQNSEFVFWVLLWLKYRYSGRPKQRRLTQRKLPQRSKSKLRSVRWIGLANEDCELCESSGLSVCALRYKCWMKEWMNEWINQWSSSNKWKHVEERKHCMCKPQSSAWLENSINGENGGWAGQVKEETVKLDKSQFRLLDKSQFMHFILSGMV